MGRKSLVTAGIVIAAFAILAASCKKVQEKELEGGAAAAKKADVAESGSVLARVDGEVIKWEDLDEAYHIERMSNRLSGEQVRRLLDNLVRERMVYLDGIEKGYDQDPEYIRHLERTKRKLINRMVMEKLARKKPEVTEEEMKRYYENHPSDFRVTEVQYLMFSPRRFDNDREKARKEAERAVKAVKGGMTMEEASKKFLDRSRPFTINMREGQNSFFGRDFDSEVEKLEPGQVAGPVQTPQGFIVAKLLKRRTQSFKEAAGYIRSLLSREKNSNRIRSYYEELEKKYKVDIDDRALEKKLEELKNQRPAGRGADIKRHPPVSPGGKPSPAKKEAKGSAGEGK